MAEEGALEGGEKQGTAKKGGVKAAGGKLLHRVKLIVLLVVIVLVVIIAFQNMKATEFRILFWPVTMPLALMLLVAFVVGGLAGAGGYMMRLKKK